MGEDEVVPYRRIKCTELQTMRQAHAATQEHRITRQLIYKFEFNNRKIQSVYVSTSKAKYQEIIQHTSTLAI